MKDDDKLILDDIIELQSIAQAGLYYGKDEFDKERYQRVRDISAHLLSIYTEFPIQQIQKVFCHEIGYQTPKLDTRAAIFNEKGEILLVQEKDGLWSLPGGWVDIHTSIKENTEKEVKEEAGLDVSATKIIAVMDRDKHNFPRYIYKVIKIVVISHIIICQNLQLLKIIMNRLNYVFEHIKVIVGKHILIKRKGTCFGSF